MRALAHSGRFLVSAVRRRSDADIMTAAMEPLAFDLPQLAVLYQCVSLREILASWPPGLLASWPPGLLASWPLGLGCFYENRFGGRWRLILLE
jgi:hypothetical protein